MCFNGWFTLVVPCFVWAIQTCVSHASRAQKHWRFSDGFISERRRTGVSRFSLLWVLRGAEVSQTFVRSELKRNFQPFLLLVLDALALGRFSSWGWCAALGRRMHHPHGTQTGLPYPGFRGPGTLLLFNLACLHICMPVCLCEYMFVRFSLSLSLSFSLYLSLYIIFVLFWLFFC